MALEDSIICNPHSWGKTRSGVSDVSDVSGVGDVSDVSDDWCRFEELRDKTR